MAGMRTLAALLLAAAAGAAEHQPAGEAGGVPPLGPAPRTTPVAPRPIDETRLDPQRQLQLRLERLLRAHDDRIRELTAAGVPAAPRAAALDPALAEPVQARDQAWRELRKALQGYVDRTPAPKRDELDRPANRALPGGGADPLSARNRLAVAECFRDLAASPEGTAKDVEDGLAALAQVDTARLGDGERALAAYLSVWLLAERARRLPADAPAEKRAKAVAEARAARDALVAQHPTSELALTGEVLVSGLDAGPSTAAGIKP